jgi:hypothetical protein
MEHFIGKFSHIPGGSRDGIHCDHYTQKSSSLKEFFYLGARVWNNIPSTLRTSESIAFPLRGGRGVRPQLILAWD